MNYLSRGLITFSLLVTSNVLFSQLGGQALYAFLELPANARVAALGGHANGVVDMDPALSWVNPASSNKLKSGGISFTQSYLFEDISHGSFLYNHYVDKWDLNFHGGVRDIIHPLFHPPKCSVPTVALRDSDDDGQTTRSHLSHREVFFQFHR